MIGGEMSMEIRVLAKHGKSIREIAREMGVARNTVRRYLREPEATRYRPRSSRPTKLDPHRAFVAERLAAAAPDTIPASVLLAECRERGYAGGYTMLKVLVASLKLKTPAEPIGRFETEPGVQMQADWAILRRGAGRLSVFVATLGWSRAAYVAFVADERIETLMACHEHAFLAFGGVPREVLYDNMKTVVIDRDAYGRGRHRFHAGFRDFAGHHGFRPRLCRPYRAQTKGLSAALTSLRGIGRSPMVERFIRYLRASFWVPFASRLAQEGLVADQDAANAAVRRWLREVANARVHATTGEIPAERLARERTRLQPLAAPYAGKVVRLADHRLVAPARPTAGLQRPLAVYDALAGASP
jgi:transposase